MNEFANGPLAAAAAGTLVLLSLALLLALIRLIKGPELPDRVVALDLMSTIAVGIIAAYAVISEENSLLDAALIVALISFVGTVAFASYLERGRAR